MHAVSPFEATEGSAATREIARESFYLALSPDPVFATLHVPMAAARPAIGVLFCPPFGWEEFCAHRSLRAWADELAAAGHAALRIDLPGSGDSGGSPRDPGRLDAWTEAVGAAAAWLRVRRGCEQIVAIGLGLGGMLAVRASDEPATIDHLVLWSVPAHGGALLRDLRAFARLRAADGSASADASVADDDALEVGGFVLSAQTVAELEQLDLTAAPMPHAAGRRVLLLGRDALAVDRCLREHLEQSGLSVTVADGPGYRAMMSHPQTAERPERLIGTVGEWIATLPGPVGDGRRVPGATVASTDHAELRVGDAVISERPFELDQGGVRLRGVLAQSMAGATGTPTLSAILLNAGALRRIGPNRMWVEIARRWAALGVPTLRLDMVGVGDSDGDERRFRTDIEFYQPDIARQLRAVMDELAARGMPPRFLLAGLCSGAHTSFQVALADERVRGVIMVNLWFFFWSDELIRARYTRAARTMLRSRSWIDLVRQAISVRAKVGEVARNRLRSALGGAHPDGHDLTSLNGTIDRSLEMLRDRGVEALLLLSEGEPLAEDFVADGRIARLGEWPNLRVVRIPIADHTFGPSWAQRHVHAAFDGALTRALWREAERRRDGRDVQPGAD